MGVACVWCASVGGQEPGKRCSASLADCDVSMLYTACACTPRRASAFLWLRPSGSGDGNVTGFSTPAAVFGHRLVDRLHGVGIRQVNVSNAMCSLLLCPKPERRAASCCYAPNLNGEPLLPLYPLHVRRCLVLLGIGLRRGFAVCTRCSALAVPARRCTCMEHTPRHAKLFQANATDDTECISPSILWFVRVPCRYAVGLRSGRMMQPVLLQMAPARACK